MYINDLLLRCKELQDQGAGDRTVVDADGVPLVGVTVGDKDAVLGFEEVASNIEMPPIEEPEDIPEAGDAD